MATLRARKLLCGYSGSLSRPWCKKVLFETTNEDLREINIRSYSRKLGLSNEMVAVIISEFRIWTWVICSSEMRQWKNKAEILSCVSKSLVLHLHHKENTYEYSCVSTFHTFGHGTKIAHSWTRMVRIFEILTTLTDFIEF